MAIDDPYASQRGGTLQGSWGAGARPQANAVQGAKTYAPTRQAPAPAGAQAPVVANTTPDYTTRANAQRAKANALTPMNTTNPMGSLDYDRLWGQNNFKGTMQGQMYGNVATDAARQKAMATANAQQYANEAGRQMGVDASAAAVQAAKLNAERSASTTRQGVDNESQAAYQDLYGQYLTDLQNRVGANMAKFKDTDVYNMLSSANANDATGVAAAKLMEQWLDPATGETRGVRNFSEDELARAELANQMADKYDMAQRTGESAYASEADQLLSNWERTRRDESQARDAASIADRIGELKAGQNVGSLYDQNNYTQMADDFGSLLEQGGGAEAGRLFGEAMNRAKRNPGNSKEDAVFAQMLEQIASQGEDANLGQGVVGQFGEYNDSNGNVRRLLNYGGKSYDLANYLNPNQIEQILNTARANNMFTAWKRGVGDITSRY